MAELEELGEADRILFNDRKIPLEVEAVDENRVHVKGPKGGEYLLFKSEDSGDLLVRNKESPRKYASYVENLRKVGKWNRESENCWKHSKSGREIRLEKNSSGFWTITTDLEFDSPKYGFSRREFAVEEVEKLIENNPEG